LAKAEPDAQAQAKAKPATGTAYRGDCKAKAIAGAEIKPTIPAQIEARANGIDTLAVIVRLCTGRRRDHSATWSIGIGLVPALTL
jgi:hypothetical protein